MSKVITDLFQGEALLQQVRSTGVSQSMWPVVME